MAHAKQRRSDKRKAHNKSIHLQKGVDRIKKWKRDRERWANDPEYQKKCADRKALLESRGYINEKGHVPEHNKLEEQKKTKEQEAKDVKEYKAQKRFKRYARRKY